MKKFLVIFILIISLSAFLFSPVMGRAYGDLAIVINTEPEGYADIYSKPAESDDFVARLFEGEYFIYYMCSFEDWWLVEFLGKQGYMNKKHVSNLKIPAIYGVILRDTPIYSEKSSNSNIVINLDKEEIIIILVETSNENWKHVITNEGIEGFVKSKDIKNLYGSD